MLKIGTLEVEVKKDHYTGLWNIWYKGGGKWGGPYKTKKEGTEKINKYNEE